jgi:diguanylate cyclase (GGDEF)-like protein
MNIRVPTPNGAALTAIGAALGLLAPGCYWLLQRLFGEPLSVGATYVFLALGACIPLAAIGYGVGMLLRANQLLAERDDLTDLLNQRSFLRTCEAILNLAIRHGEAYSVVMMDIDHFKSVNDNHNHLVGSHILKEIAKIIERSTRRSDLTARFGGDEYVFFLPRTTPSGACEVAERIRSSVERTAFRYRDHEVRVTVSIGVAGGNAHPGLTITSAVEMADAALYEAKDLGRNRVALRVDPPKLRSDFREMRVVS